MKILEKEIGLREETRGLEQARPALDKPRYQDRSVPLADTQAELAQRIAAVTRKLREEPDGELLFAKEIRLFLRVEQVMQEAQQLLARPETGPETIAAETEVIELLLQSRRINPKGGGGGGSSPGGGGSGSTDQSALALIGAGSERDAVYEQRSVGQTTGRTGDGLPAEYRTGLDAYFNALEGNRQP